MATNRDLGLEVSRAIDDRRSALAEAVTERHYELRPALARHYGPAGRAKCLQDAGYHLSYLAESIATSSPALFADYVGWARVMLAGRSIPAEDLARNFEILREVLRRELPAGMADLACEYVDRGLEKLPELPAELPSLLAAGEPLGERARTYLESLLQGERHVASRLVLDAVEQGTPVRDIYLQVFQRCQHEVGRLWQMNRLSVAQEHYCTAASQLIMSQLYPYVFAGGEKNGRTLLATCVSGDLHEIGVRMVADFLEMEGWNTVYLGADTPTPSLLQMVAERQVDVLAVSATLTSHISRVASLIAAVRGTEAGRQVKVLVGGYPFNVDPELWRRVGADAYARDAQEAVETAERLAGGGAA
jgi:methanogenic corrinoid protein MtbC1